MSDVEEESEAGTARGAPSDEEMVAVLREAERSPLPATEVAKQLGRSYEETRDRLVALAEAGELERRKLEHGTWWRVPGRNAEPSEADIEAVRASGRLVAAGVDDDEAFEEEHASGPPPAEQESFWSGVEWQVDIEVDGRALAVLAFVGILVLAVLWRRR